MGPGWGCASVSSNHVLSGGAPRPSQATGEFSKPVPQRWYRDADRRSPLHGAATPGTVNRGQLMSGVDR